MSKSFLVPLLLLLCTGSLATGAASSRAEAPSTQGSAGDLTGESAELVHTCLACGTGTRESDPSLTVRGRKVYLHSGHCEEGWLANPELMFAKLQPKSALFTEGEPPIWRGRTPWFWLGIYAVFGMISSAASAYLAVNRGQPPAVWFFAGLVGNLAALIVLYFIIPRQPAGSSTESILPGLTKVGVTRAPRSCDSCGETMHPSAANCPGCGAGLQPLFDSEVTLSQRP